MDANILCSLLAQRILPEQFQLHGLKVVFFDPDKKDKPVGSPNESLYDTPENRAVVADVMANYATLEAAYLAEQKAIVDVQAAKAQEIITNLPDWATVKTAINAAFPDTKQNAVITKALRVVFILARTD